MAKVSLKGIRAFLTSVRTDRAFTFDMPLAASPGALDAAINASLAQRFTSVLDEPKPINVAQEAHDYAFNLEYKLIIPGTHYSGMTNNGLLEILARQGRDFAEDTAQLRNHVKDVLIREFQSKPWDDDDAGQVASEAIKFWIIDRIEEQGGDIGLTPLNPAYRARKLKDGYDLRIGIRRSKWLDAIYRKGYVRIDPAG